jgi:hypothetical protein
MTPLQGWDQTNEVIHPLHVWGAQLDNRYLIEVQRKSGDDGVLCIFDHNDKDKLIFSKDTGLAYGARFGPDAEDVSRWQDECAEYVDRTFLSPQTSPV